MKDLVEYIAAALADHPEEVRVEQVEGERGAVILELKVAPEDMGKVIGRQGKIARALRTVVRAAAPGGRNVHVEILD